MTADYYLSDPAAKLPDDLRRWARAMRHEMTDAEILLWKLLRNRRVAGAKFRRQHPIGRYILDFYCDEKKLAIELDGGQHQERIQYDNHRSLWLHAHGVSVLRFWNNQVLTETEAVMEEIYFMLTNPPDQSPSPPSPSPARRARGAGCVRSVTRLVF